MEIAESIRQDISDLRVDFDGQVHSIKASLGVAYGQSGIHNASGMLKAADAACYSAKQDGRDQVCINKANDHFETTGRFELAKVTSSNL
jgi:PleD family two-component response regulator